jgi:hypothetical protein
VHLRETLFVLTYRRRINFTLLNTESCCINLWSRRNNVKSVGFHIWFRRIRIDWCMDILQATISNQRKSMYINPYKSFTKKKHWNLWCSKLECFGKPLKARSVIAAFLAGSNLGTLRLIRIDSWLMLKEIFYIYNIILFYNFFFLNYFFKYIKIKLKIKLEYLIYKIKNNI